MFRRLVTVLLASLALNVAIYLVRQDYFSDVVPVAASEGPQVLWRFETAFLLSALQLIMIAVSVATAFFFVLLAVKNARA